MKILYKGPGDYVEIEKPYGRHQKDEIREYPDAFGKELLKTSKRQRFAVVGGETLPDPGEGHDYDGVNSKPVVLFEDMTVAHLTEALEEKGVDIPKKAKKAELVELLENAG